MRTCNVWNAAWFGNMTLTNTNWLERLVETARKLSGRLQNRLLAIYRTHVLGRLRLLSTVVTTHFTESLCHYPPLRLFSWAQREPLPHWYDFVSMVSATISLSVKHSWTSENICMLGPPSSSSLWRWRSLGCPPAEVTYRRAVGHRHGNNHFPSLGNTQWSRCCCWKLGNIFCCIFLIYYTVNKDFLFLVTLMTALLYSICCLNLHLMGNKDTE